MLSCITTHTRTHTHAHTHTDKIIIIETRAVARLSTVRGQRGAIENIF